MYPHPAGGPQSPTQLRRHSLLLVVVCVLSLIAAACTGDELGDDEAATVRAGLVEVAEGSGWRQVPAGETVLVGSTVRTRKDEGVLELRDAEVRLAPHSEGTLAAAAMELAAGEVLVEGALPVSMSSGRDSGAPHSGSNADVTGSGVYRVSLRPSPLVRVYEGDATAAAGEQERDVPALRQLALDGRHLPERPEPLSYLSSDPWDAELLAEAIAFDQEAARMVTGLQALVGRGVQPASFYGRYLDRPLVRLLGAAATRISSRGYGPAGDVLLALAIVSAADPDHEDARGVLLDVVGLRSAGARWGLIAVELGVDGESVVAVLDAREDRRITLARQIERATEASGDGSGNAVGASAGAVSGPAPGDQGGDTSDGDESDPSDDPPDATDPSDDGPGDDGPSDPGDDPEQPGGPDGPEGPNEPEGPGTGNPTIDTVVEEVTGAPTGDADAVSSTVDAVLTSPDS